jgi:hypothetical protein
LACSPQFFSHAALAGRLQVNSPAAKQPDLKKRSKPEPKKSLAAKV